MRHRYTVRLENNSIVGSATLIPMRESPDITPPTYLLSSFAILPAYRGEGHGRRLMQTIVREADKEKATLLLTVDPDPPHPHFRTLSFDELSAFYKKYGFECIVEEGEPYYDLLLQREPT